MQDIGKIALSVLLVATSLVAAHPAQAQGPIRSNKFEQSAIIIVSGFASLNPQPLPPKSFAVTTQPSEPFSPGEIAIPRDPLAPVGLNPRPLLPKALFLRHR